jgi:hypothetical protein
LEIACASALHYDRAVGNSDKEVVQLNALAAQAGQKTKPFEQEKRR